MPSRRARRGPAEQAVAENVLTATLRSLFAVVENYPDLKANQNVLELQEQLTTTENQISFARQHYNASVLDYNRAIATFPNVLIAGPFSFDKREFFDAEPEAARTARRPRLRPRERPRVRASTSRSGLRHPRDRLRIPAPPPRPRPDPPQPPGPPPGTAAPPPPQRSGSEDHASMAP